MKLESITVTDAVRHFSDYVNRVAYRGETFHLTKGNRTVAELRPVPTGRRLGDLPAILRAVPHLSADEATSLGKDIDTERRALDTTEVRDPWES